MRQATHYSLTAHAYARSLIELAEERGMSVESVGHELNDLRSVIESDAAFAQFLSDPSVGVERRSQVIEAAFGGGKVSPLVYDFLRLLNTKGRLSLLVEIAGAYSELLDDRLGKIEVDLIVAQKLSAEQVEAAKRAISSALKRDAVVHTYVDEKIIGGAVIRVGDKLIDASVKYQLQAMKERLLARAPR